MRKVMQIFRIRKIGRLLLVLLALVAIFPVFFSVTGSLMGQNEKSYADIPYQEDRKTAPCTPCTGGNISGIFFSYRITDGAEGIK